MKIITENIRVDFSGIGSALAARSAGYFVANILGAILQNIVKKHSEGLLVCAFILPAIGNTEALIFNILFFLSFFHSRLCDTICNVVILIMLPILFSRHRSRID